jgi:uncharacterized protein YndB with AHSA1/START domain
MTTQQETHALTMTKPSERELRFERIFDFPRDQVWKAYTDPTLLALWYGGGTRVETMDVRPGGHWKFVSDRADGDTSYAFEFEGDYLEVDPPKRIVQSSHNGWNGLTTTETVELEDLDGNRTRLIQTSAFSTADERDGAINNGAEMGAKYQFGQLNQLLGKLEGEK